MHLLEINCGSDFVLKTIPKVGAALREKYWWFTQEQEIYLVMENAGGHGTNEAVEKYTKIIEGKIQCCSYSSDSKLIKHVASHFSFSRLGAHLPTVPCKQTLTIHIKKKH